MRALRRSFRRCWPSRCRWGENWVGLFDKKRGSQLATPLFFAWTIVLDLLYKCQNTSSNAVETSYLYKRSIAIIIAPFQYICCDMLDNTSGHR